VPERRQLQVEPPNMTALFSEDAKRAPYADRFPLAGLEASEAVLRRAYRQAERFELLDQMLYAYTKQWLPEDLLVKADKMTMAHSLELRVPFLDHTIVEFAASLPVHMKVREDGRGGYVTKYILRKAMADVIPTPILERQKLGFHVPIWRLFGEELGAMARDVLHARSFQDLGLFRPDAVERLFTERDAKGAQRWWLLWPLVVFATWQRLFKVRV
jgi:asparagine synthase (glutamine-hydrolysing)